MKERDRKYMEAICKGKEHIAKEGEMSETLKTSPSFEHHANHCSRPFLDWNAELERYVCLKCRRLFNKEPDGSLVYTGKKLQYVIEEANNG